MVKDDRLLENPDRRGGRHRCHYSSSSDKHDDQYFYHPYWRSDKGYSSNEFKKEKLPTFDGEVKKSQDVKARLIHIQLVK